MRAPTCNDLDSVPVISRFPFNQNAPLPAPREQTDHNLNRRARVSHPSCSRRHNHRLRHRAGAVVDSPLRSCLYNRIPKHSTTQRSISGPLLPLPEKDHMARDKFGPIPDDHFENEPCGPAKNVSPMSQEWKDYIAAFRRETEDRDDMDHRYQVGDVIGPY